MPKLWGKIILIIIIVYPGIELQADEIYKWTDENGRVHYSTKAASKKAEVAKLPEITRGEVKVPSSLLESCTSHGGVDCQAGADSDGSVICGDGFTDSAQRYAFVCSTAKLEVSSISEVNRGGGFTVSVRNSKSVAALKPTAVYRFDSKRSFELEGPEKIEPFEVGEFIFEPDNHLPEQNRLEEAKKIKPVPDKIELGCTNCP